VAHLPALYRQADAVVVPVRAGGGTRIKILEAFAEGVPVISTSIGAEGIDARPDVHILMADTPEAFAVQCRRLRRDAALVEALVRNAFALVSARYSPAALAACLASPDGLEARSGA
jgi:glycosyltransferase involved in cell wall biosynthesis